MNQKENTFKNKPVDLVKQFYDQDIDHKALEKALTQRKNTSGNLKQYTTLLNQDILTVDFDNWNSKSNP